MNSSSKPSLNSLSEYLANKNDDWNIPTALKAN